MTYYVAYNPALGNALVGVSESSMSVSDGIVQEPKEGDLPDLGRVAWSPEALEFVALNQSRILSRLEFMRRMTLQQLIGELLTLSNAYPADTPVTLLIGEDQRLLESVAVDSGAKVEIYLRDS